MFDMDEVAQLALLSDSYLFRALDDEGRRNLAAAGTSRAFEAGEVIVRLGEPGDSFFMVKRGKVRVLGGSEAQPVELASLGRGSCFGEMALLAGTPRTATVEAAEPSEVVVYDKGDVDAVLASYPDVRQALELLAGKRRLATTARTG
ncbi:MAG: cyclic nucleotide-binding domain-containing protein [Myxococcota bacterium]